MTVLPLNRRKMSNRAQSRGASVLGVLALTAAAVVVSASGASAEVYACGHSVNTIENLGYAYCGGGFGAFRVGATCVSSHYPYSITIYGPKVTRKSTDALLVSTVSGDSYNCHITKAWVSV